MPETPSKTAPLEQEIAQDLPGTNRAEEGTSRLRQDGDDGESEIWQRHTLPITWEVGQFNGLLGPMSVRRSFF